MKYCVSYVCMICIMLGPKPSKALLSVLTYTFNFFILVVVLPYCVHLALCCTRSAFFYLKLDLQHDVP